MKLLTTFGMILMCAAFAAAQSQSKCFELGALKDKHVFRFEIIGNDVAGSYFIERGYDVDQTETYDFAGTRAGNSLAIKFARYAKLQGHPFEIKTATLALVKSGDAETLTAKFYGTSKSAVFTMRMQSCEPTFEALAKIARRVAFAGGADSARFELSFKAQTERRAFRLGARKGQNIRVESPGCKISFYYPDKTQSAEAGAIDVFTSEKISQTGNYLFVIARVGDAGACPTVFQITN